LPFRTPFDGFALKAKIAGDVLIEPLGLLAHFPTALFAVV
jgi:hypothetical protein